MKKLLTLCLFAGISFHLMANPVANFSASDIEGCSPLIIHFTNQSSSAVQYVWDFGNGNTSTKKDPSAIYHVPGYYTVRLIATDAGGISDTFEMKNIRVFKDPIARFKGDQTSICAGQTVQFSDLSIEGDTGIRFYNYDFGNGDVSTTKDPVTRYGKAGLYSVGLHITDLNGCESDTVFSKYLNVKENPVADFISADSQFCSVPAEVNFVNRSAMALPHNYVWDFGNGKTSTDRDPTHVYKEFGNYNVTLVTVSKNGCRDTMVRDAFVRVEALKADFKMTSGSCGPVDAEFLNLTNQERPGTAYVWEFGNGINKTTKDAKVRLKTGDYKVKLSVYAGTCFDQVEKDITIYSKPVGKILFDPPIICQTPQDFKATFSGSYENDPYKYQWKDGSFPISKDRELKYNYTGKTTHYIVLEVTNGGCKAVFWDSLDADPPGVEIIPSQDTGGCVTFDMPFRSRVTTIDSVVKYSWDFGDGGTSEEKDPVHSYKNVGEYWVKLRITTKLGCKADTNTKILVGAKIKPDFTMDTSAVCNGEIIHFINKTKETPYKASVYKWELIEINTDSTIDLPDYMQREFDHRVKHHPGDYKARLTTIHNKFCKDTFTYPFPVTIKAPLSVPSVEYDSCGPTDVIFTDNSVKATSILWTSPDEIKGLSDKKITKKLDPGLYTARLVAFNSETGCKDTTDIPFEIIGYPEVDLDVFADMDCPPVTLKLSARLKYTSNFEWHAGDTSERFYGLPGNEWSVTAVYDSMPSSFDIWYHASNNESCEVSDTIHMKGNGPLADGSVASNGECLPMKLTLTDKTYGKDGFKTHYWKINGQRIDVTQKIMITELRTLQSGSDSVLVQLYVGSDNCVDIKNFYVPVNGVNVEIETTLTDTKCDNIIFYVKAKQRYGYEELEYWWGVNSNWEKGYGPVATYSTFQKTDGGFDTVRLKVRSDKGCEMEVFKVIQSPMPSFVADFDADVTGSICPPLNVDFKDRSRSSNPIVSWDWNFGEDARSDLQNPSRIYLLPGRYPVSLTVTDAKGCKATVTYPDFITIKGPVVKAEIKPKMGCVPLTVDFKATSEEDVSFKWDLGDGNLRSDDEFSYTYKQPGRFIPLITVADSFGCKYTLPPADTIIASDMPDREILFEGFCAGQPVLLWPEGTVDENEITGIYWELGDGTKDTGLTTMHVYPEAGIYLIKLKMVNYMGCVSESELELKITGATPHFEPGKKVICLNEEVEVVYTGTPLDQVTIMHWKLDGQLLPHTRNSFIISYGEKGIHALELEVATPDGCHFRYEDEQAVSVADDQPLGMAEIRHVSVIDDEQIELKVSEENNPYLETYKPWIVYGNNTYTDLTEWDAEKNTYVADGFNTLKHSYCLVVTRENHCAAPQLPDSSFVHCTIELQAHGDTARNELNWSPYVGWAVNEYEIFSKQDIDGEWKYLDRVPGSQLNYTDSILTCETERRYRILAHEEGGFEEYSFSDTAHSIPLFNNVVPAPEVWRVSVEDDREVLIEWIQPKVGIHPIEAFELVQINPDGRAFLAGTGPVSTLDTIDRNVLVDDHSYIYTVRARDTCKSLSPYSNIGKTILLQATFDKELLVPVLNWTRYREWNEGVSHYLIEKRTPDGQFQVIGRSMGATDTTFIDETAIEQCSPEFCYRVTGIRNQPENFPDSTHDVISHSNVDCADVVSHLYAPNAFTMNNDGLNETFQPVGMYIHEYNLKIFNRWGELLFETDNCMEGWDGTYKGEQCMMGTYLFIITATGSDRQAHNMYGTVHLLK